MSLTDHVRIQGRFRQSIRIDQDLGNWDSLEGFICPKSSALILLAMADHVTQSGQAAFTWTGPYGSGKSSLVVALSALLGSNPTHRSYAEETIGNSIAQEIKSKLPPKAKGWRSLGIVGRRADPTQAIGEALNDSGLIRKRRNWTETYLMKCLLEISQMNSRSHGGLIVYIDEMGKFLEAAAQEKGDVYIFQQLAEVASRSKGRLVIVGILHQAFEEYASRLSHDSQKEWEKIQGRFVDLPISVSNEEQIDLIARAIETDKKEDRITKVAAVVSKHIREKRSGTSGHFTKVLTECWPLHPITTTLLGPISRRRSGQNQRSIFGFLNSHELNGFQDFLQHANESSLYEPPRLWDYLRTSMESSVLASSEGHRWALAVEAIERCDAMGGDELHINLLKSIALIDFFKDRLGLVASLDILRTCTSGHSKQSIKEALDQLCSWSLIIYKKFLDTYAIYAGSDFDIEQAVEEKLDEQSDIDFVTLRSLASLQSLLAKRHYHEYGTLRWFDVDIAPLDSLVDRVASFCPRPGVVGQFLLAIPTSNEKVEQAESLCKDAACLSKNWDSVVGLSQHSWTITDLTRQLLALEKVRNERMELQGDSVARREVQARLATLQAQVEAELQKAFDHANWFRKDQEGSQYTPQEINSLASDLADKRYPKTPCFHNELLNRIKPSTSAVAARNILLRRMLNNPNEARLGMTGYPAERGLFVSILERPGLYVDTSHGGQFVNPKKRTGYPAHLTAMWREASRYLRQRKNRPVGLDEIYKLWGSPPFGLAEGLAPVLAVAYILSNQSTVVFYREGIFQAKVKDIDLDYLTRDPADVQLRWMDLNAMSRKLLSGLAEVVRDLDETNTLEHLEPIDVGRGLIAIYDSLHPWTKRTARLSKNAVQIRDIFKKANDPNQLLFDDLPVLARVEGGVSTNADLDSVEFYLREGLEELVNAYPLQLKRFSNIMLDELQVPNNSPQALADLRARAENIRQLAGDFRLDAFVGRLNIFENTFSDIEGLASLAASKPLHSWVDSDLDRATIAIAELAQNFNRVEAFARVKGRPDKRHAMAVMVGVNGAPTSHIEEFDVTDLDRIDIDGVVTDITSVLEGGSEKKHSVILAALAEVSAQYMKPLQKVPKEKRKP